MSFCYCEVSLEELSASAGREGGRGGGSLSAGVLEVPARSLPREEGAGARRSLAPRTRAVVFLKLHEVRMKHK